MSCVIFSLSPIISLNMILVLPTLLSVILVNLMQPTDTDACYLFEILTSCTFTIFFLISLDNNTLALLMTLYQLYAYCFSSKATLIKYNQSCFTKAVCSY